MPSTVIRSYSYDARRRELDIVFQTRRRYRYRHVPMATYAALKVASSKGEFFNRHIRGRFQFSRDPLGDGEGNR
jgi:hypothetical protein